MREADVGGPILEGGQAAPTRWADVRPGLRMAWQPIVNVRAGTVWGYEALVRGPGGAEWEMPTALFALARESGIEREVEGFCRNLACCSAPAELPQGAVLFVNADPLFPGEPLPEAGAAWPRELTVIEVSERSSAFRDPDALVQRVAGWRAAGFRVALDDFGSGYANGRAMLTVRPDIVKIDAELVRGIDRDPWRQELVASIIHTNADLGVTTIAEGVEEPGELNQLVVLGVGLAQGFLLGRPDFRACREWPVRGPAPAQQVAGRLAAALPPARAAYAVDRARRVTAWNEEAAGLLGHSAEAMVGKACWLTGLDHRDAAGRRLCFRACPLVTAMETGQRQSGIVSARTESGHRRWVAVEVEPVCDEAGEVIGAVEHFAAAAAPAAVSPSLHAG